MESPAISRRAQKTLQDLRDDGRTVSDADVVWLVTLAAKIDRPVGDELGPLSGAPLIVGGVECRISECNYVGAVDSSKNQIKPAFAYSNVCNITTFG